VGGKGVKIRDLDGGLENESVLGEDAADERDDAVHVGRTRLDYRERVASHGGNLAQRSLRGIAFAGRHVYDNRRLPRCGRARRLT
jgi:hypothetical protein